MDSQVIIDFWFDEIAPANWWQKDVAFDAMIVQRFLTVHQAAAHGELWAWREQPAGRLAEVSVLDQFSRNIYRDDTRAFACDGQALALAQEVVRASLDRELYPVMRAFVYMPYMHSESGLIHQQAVKLFDQPGLESNLYEQRQRLLSYR